MTVTAVFACVGSPVEREKVSSMKASSYCTSIRLTLRDVTVTNLFLPCFVLGHFSIFFFFRCSNLSPSLFLDLYPPICLSVFPRTRPTPPYFFLFSQQWNVSLVVEIESSALHGGNKRAEFGTDPERSDEEGRLSATR